MVCVPYTPADDEEENSKKSKKKKLTPVGFVSRNKDFDFIGGKIIAGCTCGRRNGLEGDGCRRLSCQNNPGCMMSPPRCWPQIPNPEPSPPPPPKQDMICIPIEIVYTDPNSQNC